MSVLQGLTMGTTWSVRLYAEGRSLAALEAEVQARLCDVVDQMSQWQGDSALCRFNRAPPGWITVPELLFRVMACALDVAERTGGAFDPTLGRLADLWGFGPSGGREAPPSASDIAAALGAAGWRRLELDGPGRRLKQPGGVALDLSGIAKGFAVDHLAEHLAASGVGSFLVEIGGELKGSGVKADGQPWWVALEAPPGAETLPRTVVALHSLSAATSGDYRRYFEHDGARYAHTLDPRSGLTAAGLSSVTVLHQSCMIADALATAIGVLGLQQGFALAETMGVAAWLALREGNGATERLSPALLEMLD
jgi:FAD:protein FMN transferase